MKRQAAGGAHRGPVARSRQTRTLRLVQGLLVIAAAALLMFAGYTWGRAAGFDDARRADRFDAPRRPSAAQVVVLGALGLTALAAALVLQGSAGVRMPAPARLDELAGRAEGEARARVERLSSEARSEQPETTETA